MTRFLVHLALVLLAALEIVAGLIAGSAALASLITEAVARTVSAGALGFARWAGVDPMSLRLREELAAVLATTATTTTPGATR